jgi:GMP reductase
MRSVQNTKALDAYAKANLPYVYQRQGGIFHEDKYLDVELFLEHAELNRYPMVSISVGVSPEDLKFLETIKDHAIDWLTIDVAYLYNETYADYIKKVREMFPDVYLIGGNFASFEAAEWLQDLGFDCLKYGVGTSKVCRSRQYTGFGSSLSEFFYLAEKIDADLIYDGGLTILDKEKGEFAYGDIFKLLNFGAKWVMSGSLFSYSTELANESGEIIHYGNSTSMAKGHDKNVEGVVEKHLTNGKSVAKLVEEIKDNLRSSCSYAGIKRIDEAFKSCKVQNQYKYFN